MGRKKPFFSLKTKRRLVQCGIALAFIIIPILNRSRYSYVYGNFLAFHLFGVPLADPLAILQLTIRNFYLTLDNVIGALLPLLLAFFLGTVFCSWMCPYGLLSELNQGLARRLLPAKRSARPGCGKAFPVKLVIFLLGFVGFFFFSTTPILNQMSMPAWYARFFQYLFGQDFVSLCFLFIFGLLGVEFLARQRLWCRFVCPQSVLISLVKQLDRGRLRVVFAEERCICRPGYERCLPACTLLLNPKALPRKWEPECSNCGDCVTACSRMGQALTFEFMHRRHVLAKSRRYVLACLALAVLTGMGYLGIQQWSRHQAAQEKVATRQELHRQTNPLLINHKVSFGDGRASFYELLENGTCVCVGGQWPLNGFSGFWWEAVGDQGGFRIMDESTMVMEVTPERTLGMGASVTLKVVANGNPTTEKRKVVLYEPLGGNHQQGATTMNATARLFRFADEIYELQLRVQDPHERIRKIWSEGDAITNEVMLTSVKYWLNTPPILASEGQPPKLPIHTKMRFLFHDGHEETAVFETSLIEDRSNQEFEDPWF